MAYDCRVYRILIASPSDVEEEREIAVRVIQEWNDLYSYSRKIALLPLRWETHTAPEYGTRPQEVINRAIVDQCDLLVGIFWTRIGSPTGVAESGTLEEIERVGNAEKPVMLYFSRVEIDPDRIDLSQIEKLKSFKKKTYPKGLTESYKTIIEFRDKFAKQLELRVRDIQRMEASGELPLSLEFLSIEKGKPIGNQLNHSLDNWNVAGLKEVPREKREIIRDYIDKQIKQSSYIPVALVIANESSSGIRNLFIELYISSSSEKVEITDSIQEYLSTTGTFTTGYMWDGQYTWAGHRSAISEEVESKLAKFDSDTLQHPDQGWRLSFEWEALQPQRTRLVKPVLYVHSPESATLSLSAKVFADSFPEPFLLEAEVRIEVKQRDTALNDVLPKWKELIEEDNSKKSKSLTK